MGKISENQRESNPISPGRWYHLTYQGYSFKYITLLFVLFVKTGGGGGVKYDREVTFANGCQPGRMALGGGGKKVKGSRPA